jgi:hypothetical protein
MKPKLTKRQRAKKNADYLAMRGGSKARHERKHKYWCLIHWKECQRVAAAMDMAIKKAFQNDIPRNLW